MAVSPCLARARERAHGLPLGARRAARPLALIAGALLAGCATRSVPQRYPASSPASPRAEVPARQPVAPALAAQPSTIEGAATQPPSDAHRGHGGEHGH